MSRDCEAVMIDVRETMDDHSLQYASPGTPATVSEAQRRRRKRMALSWALALLVGFCPYPTTVCPSIKLKVVDDKGAPLGIMVSARWEGATNAGRLEGDDLFDNRGQLSLERQRVWVSPVSRVMSWLAGELLPHNGNMRGTVSTLNFNIPAGYSLDPVATGLNPNSSWPRGTINNWIIPQTGDGVSVAPPYYGTGEVLYLIISEPGRWNGKDYFLTIVLRRALPATQPATP